MPSWTLTFGEDTRTLSEWGLKQCVLSEQSLSAAMLTAQMPGDMLATLPWSYEDTVTLQLDGVTQFKGVVLSPKRSGGGFSEGIMLRFANPWWYLSQGTYVQPWWVKASSTAYDAPRVALFANITPGDGWVKRTIAEDIADIVSQCNAYFGGSVMQLGELRGDGFAAMPIPQRVNNVTYESVLRQVLAWVPDAIQQWDYTTSPPTISFVQRAAATARSYSFGAGGVMMEQEFLRRDDLALRGIEITYAGLDAFGFVTKVVDQAGETTGTRLLKTVIDCTGNASGATATSPTSTPAITRDYTVVSEAIDATAKAWWFKYGDTGAQSEDDIAVLSGTVEFAPNAPENEGKTDLGGCGLQWLEGGIPKSRLSANTRVALVTGELIIRTTKTEAAGSAPVTATETQQRRTIKMLVPVTKLSGNYTQVIAEAGSSIGGGIPQLLSPIYLTPGLAALLLAAWGTAQWDGALKLCSGECEMAVRPGDVVNITGGLSEWATMATQVHSVTHDIDAGTTTVQTGVAEHLGVDEYANLLRMTRLRTVPAMDLDQQTLGEVPADVPDPNEQDDMVGPGSVKYSVLEGAQKIITTTATALVTTDYTDEAGPTISNKDTASGDEAVTTPGKMVAKNAAAEKTVTMKPDSLRLERADGGFILHDNANQRILAQDAAGKTCEVKATKIELLDSGGNGTSIDANGITITAEGGLTIQLTGAGGLVITDGTKSTTLNLLQLLHDNGTGKTAGIDADGLHLTKYGGTVDLTVSDGLNIDTDGDTLSASPYGVNMTAGSGETAQFSATAGLQLSGSGGTVTVEVVGGQAISLQNTQVCDVDEGGEPVTKTMKVLRGPAA